MVILSIYPTCSSLAAHSVDSGSVGCSAADSDSGCSLADSGFGYSDSGCSVAAGSGSEHSGAGSDFGSSVDLG